MQPQTVSNNLANIVPSHQAVTYLEVTDEAIVHAKKILSERKEKCEGIRINVKSTGCSGMSYKIEYAVAGQNVTKFDDIVVKNGVTIYIDPKASIFLIGSKMIYREDELKSGFDFINPNEKGRCGCGESFNA